MEDRPIVAVFDGVIGSIVSAPTFDAQQKATPVEVPGKELAAGRGIGSQELSLEQGPLGW
jgi:hypothetical protein